ncbi:MAG TPA: DNA-3-methyladenine glycosylase 2 family protein [Microbacteriaceae bacterium]
MDVELAQLQRAEDVAAAPLHCSYTPREPVGLRLTLGILGRGPHDPTTQWDAAGLWRTFLTPLGAATLRLTQTRFGVDATAWGPGAQWALDGLPDLLGASDDWSGLDVSAHPLLAQARRRAVGLRLTRTRRVFEALAPAVIEQRVTSLEAYRSWARLVRAHGTAAPGPAPDGMRVAPSAEVWRRIPSWEWHRTGVDPRRSRALVTAAGVATGLERTAERNGGAVLSGAVVAARLCSVSGIGVWTAAETAQRAHGDPDAISVGDYHLASIVGYALTGSATDDDGMLELLNPWAGQRQRVVRLIGVSGVMPPRRGPRATITDHRRH